MCMSYLIWKKHWKAFDWSWILQQAITINNLNSSSVVYSHCQHNHHERKTLQAGMPSPVQHAYRLYYSVNSQQGPQSLFHAIIKIILNGEIKMTNNSWNNASVSNMNNIILQILIGTYLCITDKECLEVPANSLSLRISPHSRGQGTGPWVWRWFLHLKCNKGELK